jgi:hypothetical protein
MRQSLIVTPLKQPADFFTSNTETVPKVIEGRGQKLYWKDCNNVYIRDNNRAGTTGDWAELRHPSGEAIVQVDVDLYFYDGLVKTDGR